MNFLAAVSSYTEALLSAVPIADMSYKRKIVIAGEILAVKSSARLSVSDAVPMIRVCATHLPPLRVRQPCDRLPFGEGDAAEYGAGDHHRSAA